MLAEGGAWAAGRGGMSHVSQAKGGGVVIDGGGNRGLKVLGSWNPPSGKKWGAGPEIPLHLVKADL